MQVQTSAGEAVWAVLQACAGRAWRRLWDIGPHWLLGPDNRLFWVYLLSFVALGAYAWRRFYRQPAPGASMPGAACLRFMFPAAIYRHPSALVDYQMALLNRVLGPSTWLFGLVGGSASIAIVADFTQRLLAPPNGVAAAAHGWTITGVVLFTLGVAALRDLVTFFVHLLHHRVPLLWEFHQVHHSAEVLTPLTVYRKHPVYTLCERILTIAMVGPAQGVLALGCAGVAMPLTLFGANFVFALFHLAGANLRHSHIWLPFGFHLSHVFISPAQHQIHHSTAPRHQGRNYGEVFALWDWLCGTLYVPSVAPEALQFGLGTGVAQPHGSVWRAYAVPCVNGAALLGRYLRRSPCVEAAPAVAPRRE